MATFHLRPVIKAMDCDDLPSPSPATRSSFLPWSRPASVRCSHLSVLGQSPKMIASPVISSLPLISGTPMCPWTHNSGNLASSRSAVSRTALASAGMIPVMWYPATSEFSGAWATHRPAWIASAVMTARHWRHRKSPVVHVEMSRPTDGAVHGREDLRLSAAGALPFPLVLVRSFPRLADAVVGDGWRRKQVRARVVTRPEAVRVHLQRVRLRLVQLIVAENVGRHADGRRAG